MKNKIKYVLMISFIFFCFSCTKTDDGDYVKPITTYELIQGTWKVTGLIYTDEIALSNGVAKDAATKSIIGKLKFNTMEITFNADTTSQENTVPTTYHVSGDAPKIIPVDGYWDMDNPYMNIDESPTNVILYSDNAKTAVTAKISITKRPQKKLMEMKLYRSKNDVAYLSYTFTLLYQNQ